MSKRKAPLKEDFFDDLKQRLHTSSIPASLPCREKEFQDVYTFLESKIREGVGGYAFQQHTE